MNTAILAVLLATVPGVAATGTAPAVKAPATGPAAVLMVAPAPAGAAAEYESRASKYAEKAAMYRKMAANPPAHATFLEGKHPMAPGTRAHSIHFAEKYEVKAREASAMAAKLNAAAELEAAAE